MNEMKNSSNLMFYSNVTVLQYSQIFFPFEKVFTAIAKYDQTFRVNYTITVSGF